MEPRISSLKIERFRALRELRIEGLGRVNLITGRNNTGKSSVLEALRLLASGASAPVIFSILYSREEVLGDPDEKVMPSDEDGFSSIMSLFHGFPRLSPETMPIVIASSGRQAMDLSLRAAWLVNEAAENGSRRIIAQEEFDEDVSSPGLIVSTGDTQRPLTPRFLSRYAHPYASPFLFGPTEESNLPCVFVSPYGGAKTASLGSLWDKIALSDLEKDVVNALRIIDPDISAVNMIGGEKPRRTRTAIVRSESIARPVPLRSFGDGLNRLFGIVLSLVNAKDGLLLIDEFENGMHHTVQADVWRAVFRLAKDLDIQVVATSHSWDAVEAFQQVASESAEEGLLIRLSRKGEDVIPTLFREDELAVATRSQIEVR